MNTSTVSRRQFLGTAAAASMAMASPQTTTGNERIDQARQVALDILKPSRRDFDYGLKLHAESIVFDCYGFSPRAAVDGDAIRRAMDEGAADKEVRDMRENMTMTRPGTVPAERTEFLEAWRAAGMTCIFQNAGEESSEPLRLLKRLARFTYLTDKMRDVLRRAAEPDDIVQAKKDGVGCLYFSGNGVPLTQDWISAEDELRLVEVFFQLGIRMMHMTYNRRNRLGDGCAETANGGLSDLGRAAVDELNRVGVIVDVAHSGWQTSLEAAQRSQRPMVASHSTCAAVHKHIRSKPDNVIRAIADTGGYIGICCIPRFLRHSGDIVAMLDHIDHVVKGFGADQVAIGTDVAYTSRLADRESAKVPSRGRRRPRLAALWPPDDWKTTDRMRQSIAWINWPMFTVGMVQRGYKDEQIRKVIGENVLRVTRAALA